MTSMRKIAWRNIWRHPRRSVLTMLAIVFSCVLLIFSVSLQFGSYDAMINVAVRVTTGHIKIQHKDYLEDRKIRLAIEHPGKVTAPLEKLPFIESFASRAHGFALVSSNGRTYGVSITGIEPDREQTISSIDDNIAQGSYVSSDESTGVIIGTSLADNLKVTLGDELVMLGSGYDGSFAANVLHVRGIFETGQPQIDRGILQMPLATFQETFSMGTAVHEIVILGRNLDVVPQLVTDIRNRLNKTVPDAPLAVLPWQKLMPGLEQGIKMDMVTAWITYIILLIVVAFSIMNTFLMAILERTHEFGVLLAVGLTRTKLAWMVILESWFMTMMGIAGGILAGCAVTWYFSVHGIDFGNTELFARWGVPSVIKPQISLLSLGLGPGVVLVFTMLTALLPLRKIFQLEPAKAMKAL